MKIGQAQELHQVQESPVVGALEAAAEPGEGQMP